MHRQALPLVQFELSCQSQSVEAKCDKFNKVKFNEKVPYKTRNVNLKSKQHNQTQ